MKFEQNKSVEKWGEKVGYLFSYFLFTTFLYFILSFLDKLPPTWSYYHIMAITFCIALGAIIVRRLLR